MPTINCLYDPSTGDFGSIPDSVTVPNGATETITINLSLVTSASGTIVFDNPPLTWGKEGPPPGTETTPSIGGTTQETIKETNSNSSKTDLTYGFLINFVYTSPTAVVVYGSGDPTIINDGTGG